MVDIQSATAENRRGKKKNERRMKEETTAAEYDCQPYWAAMNKQTDKRWSKQNLAKSGGGNSRKN